MDGRQTMTSQEPDLDDVGLESDQADAIATACADSLPNNRAFRCPVCGADQIPAEECRRCRADLEMFLKLRAQVDQKRVQCLALIRQRRLLRATQSAKECLELSADEGSLRLLVTCYLLQGDFASAMQTLAEAG